MNVHTSHTMQRIGRPLVAGLARRLTGSRREIKDLPEWAGFGNQLFFYLWAAARRWSGHEVSLVRGPRSESWFKHFPALRDLTIGRSEVRWDDVRDRTSWEVISGAGIGDPHRWELVGRFIDEYLLASDQFIPRVDLVEGVTLNVRRGDYFSDPSVRGRFGFDQLAYTEVVLDRLRSEERPPGVIRVVSDDLDWCRARLGRIVLGDEQLTFPETSGPTGDLEVVAGSRELIIMNSSFSIWAAYISNRLHGDNHRLVHVPAFGTRPFHGSPWPSIDPRWDVVESIPGGWDS